MKKIKKIISSSLAALSICGCLSPASYANPNKKSNTIKDTAIKIGAAVVIGVPLVAVGYYGTKYFLTPNTTAVDANYNGETESKVFSGNINYRPQTKTEEFSGIENLGNTCYLNSVLQLLYQIPEIRIGNLLDKNHPPFQFLNTMMEKIKNNTSATEDKSLNETITGLIRALKLKTETQQDAYETFQKFNFPGDFISQEQFYPADKTSINDFAKDKNIAGPYLLIHVPRANVGGGVDKTEIDIREQIETQNGTYELKSVVYHSGNATFGHYVTCSKSSQSGQWYLCNDSEVYPVGSKPMEDGTKGFYSTMLLYSKKYNN